MQSVEFDFIFEGLFITMLAREWVRYIKSFVVVGYSSQQERVIFFGLFVVAGRQSRIFVI